MFSHPQRVGIPAREEVGRGPASCPRCGCEATEIRYSGGDGSILCPAKVIECSRCAARDAAVEAVRFGGQWSEGRWNAQTLTPEQVKARALVSLLERLAADAADPTASSDAAKAAAKSLAEVSRAPEKWKRQQAGNENRKILVDGWEAEAAAMNRAGEPWKVVAPKFGLKESRCRELVRKAGCKTRGST